MQLWLLALLFSGPPADRIEPSPQAEPPAAVAAEADEEDEGEEAESESALAEPQTEGIRYSADLTDEDLLRRWKESPDALGSISVGFADNGRLINSVHMPRDPAWICQRPDLAWGTQETVDALARVFRAVHEQFPGSAPAHLSHIGAKDGGYLRPHRSHQSGRDADIAFFYKDDHRAFGAHREKRIDPARNWALIKAVITQTDVQVILVDRGIQRVLKGYALAAGEDPEWLDRVFSPGRHALVQHARKHRDHFHVRFFSPRSQELGRRIQPLLAKRPDRNVAMHRVLRGQTLLQIAKVYGSSVKAIRRANHLRTASLRLDQRLVIPMRKPCTRCPLPPPVVVPARCLPRELRLSMAETAG